jgi:hypothetical protein
MKVDKKTYSKGSFPAIGPDDLDGDLVVVTIATVEEVDFGKGDKALVATYEEIDDKKHRLNMTSIGRLIDGFDSDNTDDWEGKKIALEITSAPNPQKGGKIGKSVWVADPEEWPKPTRRAVSAKKRGK